MSGNITYVDPFYRSASEVGYGASQGVNLRLLVFLIYMNGLIFTVYGKDQTSNLRLYQPNSSRAHSSS